MAELGMDWLDATDSLTTTGINLPVVVSILALVLYATINAKNGNDDDDSSPGGGLMQPVA
jgi:hypothetical protein